VELLQWHEGIKSRYLCVVSETKRFFKETLHFGISVKEGILRAVMTINNYYIFYEIYLIQG